MAMAMTKMGIMELSEGLFTLSGGNGNGIDHHVNTPICLH